MSSLPDGFEIMALKDLDLGPIYMAHRTAEPKYAEAIAQKGFDLKKFGYSAKKFNMPGLAENDPVGIYATPHPFGDEDNIYAGEGYVVFLVNPEAKVLVHEMEGSDAKRALYSHYEATSSKDLSNKLLALGVDGVISRSLDNEYIALNTESISLDRVGIRDEIQFPIASGLEKPFAQDAKPAKRKGIRI